MVTVMVEQTSELIRSKSDIFWGEIAPCDHVVQIYENDEIFLDALMGFVGGGINAGDSVIVIATEAHQRGLETRLSSLGLHINALIAEDMYIPLNAEKTLARFMRDGWPDEALFNEVISKLIQRAGRKNRRIRAFGEMVAILWADGHHGATVQLEHLWNRFAQQASFCLFCAYPRTGFTQDMNTSITEICSCHSKMLDGTERSITNVAYRNHQKTG